MLFLLLSIHFSSFFLKSSLYSHTILGTTLFMLTICSNTHFHKQTKQCGHGRFASIGGRNSCGRLQLNTHFTRHERLLCHSTTHGALRFFSFTLFPLRIGTLVNARKWCICLHPASSLPQPHIIKTHISITMSPSSSTIFSNVSSRFFYGHDVSLKAPLLLPH